VGPAHLPVDRIRKNTAFTWFDKLTAGFDKPVLSPVEGLRANGTGMQIVGNSPFVLSLSKHENEFSRGATPYVQRLT
jgi:hypothetical protein